MNSQNKSQLTLPTGVAMDDRLAAVHVSELHTSNTFYALTDLPGAQSDVLELIILADDSGGLTQEEEEEEVQEDEEEEEEQWQEEDDEQQHQQTDEEEKNEEEEEEETEYAGPRLKPFPDQNT